MIKKPTTNTFILFAIIIFCSFKYKNWQQSAKNKIATAKIWCPVTDRSITTGKNGNVRGYYWYKNVGNAPLIINKASGSGGSTVPDYSRKPLKVGDWHYISIKYDSKRIGSYRRTSSVQCNAKESANFTLRITGTIHNTMAKPYDPSTEITKIQILKYLIDSSATDTLNKQYIAFINKDSVSHQILDCYSLEDEMLTNLLTTMKYPISLVANDTTYLPIIDDKNITVDSFNYLVSFITDENLEHPFVYQRIRQIYFVK